MANGQIPVGTFGKAPFSSNAPISDLGAGIAANFLTQDVPQQFESKSLFERNRTVYRPNPGTSRESRNLQKVVGATIGGITGAPSVAARAVAEQRYSPKIQKELRSKTATNIARRSFEYASSQDPTIDIAGIRLETPKETPFIGRVGLPGAAIPGYQAYSYQTQGAFAQRFVSRARQDFLNAGYNPVQAEELAQALAYRELLAGGLGEAGSAVAAGAGSQAIGAKELARLSAKRAAQQGGKQLTRQQLARQTTVDAFKAIAPAGAFEGGASYAASSEARRQPLRLQEGLLAVLGGGAFAGALGSAIARTAVTRPVSSKALTGISYIIDPYELPGDVYEAGLRRGIPQLRRPPLRGGTFNVATGTPVQEAQRAGYLTPEAAAQLEALYTPVQEARRPTTPRRPKRVPLPAYSQSPYGPRVPANANVPPSVPPNIPPNTPPSQKPPGAPTNEPTSNVPANVPVATTTPVGIPVVTALPRNLILPPLFAGEGETPRGPGSVSRANVFFVDELERARRSFLRFFR